MLSFILTQGPISRGPSARGGRSCEHFGGYKTINQIPFLFICRALCNIGIHYYDSDKF